MPGASDSEYLAASLVDEAMNLRERVTRGQASHVAIKDEFLSKLSNAADRTRDPDLLLVIANLVQPYARVDRRARSLMHECRSRADRSGGGQSNIATVDQRTRRLQSANSGCVLVAGVLVLGSASILRLAKRVVE
jgi:hypothetical protein